MTHNPHQTTPTFPSSPPPLTAPRAPNGVGRGNRFVTRKIDRTTREETRRRWRASRGWGLMWFDSDVRESEEVVGAAAVSDIVD